MEEWLRSKTQKTFLLEAFLRSKSQDINGRIVEGIYSLYRIEGNTRTHTPTRLQSMISLPSYLFRLLSSIYLASFLRAVVLVA